ncbi:MAG: DUF4838 domain-containing protein, partial [Clostridia bacterium]|nr:DUF4838 domain-containing protein [Clostridia bacterium]
MIGKRKMKTINALLIMCVTFLGSAFIVSTKNDNSVNGVAATQNSAEKVFEMDGAAIRLSNPTGLRFAAVVDPETVEEVEQDENKTFGGLIVPYSYFDTYGVSKSGDYLSNFLAKDLTLAYKEDLEVTKKADEDGNYSVDYSIVNLHNYNLNRDFFGILYIKTVDGDTTTYEYAEAEPVSLQSKTVRSVAYVASAAYNEESKYSDTQLTILENFILKSAYMESQDNANISDDVVNNAVANMTMDSYFSDISLNGAAEVGLDLSTRSYEASLTNLDLYSNPNILYSTSDKEVASVSEDGVVTPWSAGTATISTKILGKTFTYQVTVNDDLDFVENGESTYRIVLPIDYTEVEKIAADELNYFMEEATGATFDIVYDDDVTYTENGRYIYIGAVEQLQAAGITLPSSLGAQGYKVQQKGKSIFIAGYNAKGNGAAFGVYSLLEDLVGFDYFAYDEMTLDTKSNIVLSDYAISTEQAPAIQNANTQSIYAVDVKAQLRLGFVGLKDVFYLGDVSPYHNSFIYLSKDKYQASHPNWYSTDGKQICYTARGNTTEYNAMVNTAYAGMKNTYQKAKAAGYETVNLSFTMEDNQSVCDCTACVNARNTYKSDSGAMVKFCNDLSNKFAADGITDVNIYFFAYFGYEQAPSGITCNANVGPIYCNMSASNYSSVNPNSGAYSSTNSFVSERINAWKDISNHVAVWEYSAYWANFMLPAQIFRAMEDDYNYYAQLDLDYFFDQGKSDSNGLYGTYFSAYAFWKKSKLVWGEEHTAEEFFNQYYRDAASDMLGLYNATTQFLTSFYVEGKENYPLATLNNWKGYISAAESSIAGYRASDEALYTKLYNRIGAESAFVDYLLLKYYGDTFTMSEYESLLDRFYAECENGGITQWNLSKNDVHTALTNTINATVADVVSIINTIDESEELAQTLQKISAARKMYDSLAETQQSQVTNYATLTSFEEVYGAYLCVLDYTEFNGTQPFAKDSLNYLAQYNLGLYNDADYGIVMSANVYNTRNEHFAIRYSSPAIDASKYEMVQFYVYNGGVKDTYLFYSMQSGFVQNYALLKAGQWNLITVPTQDFVTGKYFGVLKCEAVQYKFSAIFAKSDSSMVEAVENLISAIPTTIDENSVDAILAARAAYDKLTANLQANVSNYEKLTNAEAEIKAIGKEDETAKAFNQSLVAFNEGFEGITFASLKTVTASISAIETSYASLTDFQKMGVDEDAYEEYLALKNSFKVIDDMSGLDIASRFNLNAGSNGINNGETAPGVAATLNDATYGPCATIGKNSAGLEISYAATAGLDLSGYNYVLFAVKNNLGVTIDIQNRVSGAVLVDDLASGTFGIVKMTVNEFLNSGIAMWVNNQGSVWISSIIAVNMDDSYDELMAEYNALMEEILTGEVTAETAAKVDEAKAIYNQLPEINKLLTKDVALLVEIEEVLAVANLIDEIGVEDVSEEWVKRVSDAREAFNGLSSEKQAKVYNKQVLFDAEELINSTVNAPEIHEAIEAIQNFLDGFSGFTMEKRVTLQAQIASVESVLANVSTFQLSYVTNYEEYLAAKNSFKVIDDMTGTDIASRFNLNSGANGINNGETAPGVAATLNDATYGPCATIGKNSAGLEISYAATAGLDLSGYNYVLIAVKNNLGVSITVKDRKTGAAISSEIASGTFGIVKMTVDQFLNSGMALWVANQGSVWLSAIVAVNLDVTSEIDAELAKFISEFPAEITLTNYREAQTKIDAMEETLSTLTEDQKATLTNYEEYLAAKNSFMVIDDMTGTDIASRFTFHSGSNGINNGETAPGVAATLNDATYGPCATIGKNSAGLEFSYAATEGLDLSGYNYVLIAVKNNLGVSITVKDRKTGAA